MLTFESPFYEIKDVIVFRDHISPTTFHYLAGPPRLTRDEHGKPNLLLMKYRNALDSITTTPRVRDQLGGAFLMFGVDCGLSQGVKDDIVRELQEHVPSGAGEVSLVPVLYTKGTVHVIALDAQQAAAGAADAGTDPDTHSKFVRGVIGTATPSLLQDQRAIFSLALSTDAATLIEDAYRSELSPIGVMYELEFSGLRPALSVRAKIDKRRVYESLKLGFHIGVSTGGGQAGGGAASTQGGGGSTTGQATPAGGGASPSVAGGGAPRAASVAGGGASTVGGGASTVGGGASTVVGGASTVGGAASTGGGAATAGGGAASTGGGATTGGGAATTGGGAATAGGGAASTGGGGAGQGGAAPSGAGANGVQVAVDADISYAIEKMEETGAIEIEIIQQQEGKSADDMRASAMDLIKESLLKDFYAPAMSAAPTPATGMQSAAGALGAAQGLMATSGQTNQGNAGGGGSGGGGTKIQAAFQLQMKKTEELTVETFDYSITAPETRTHAPNGFFSALVGATEQATCIRTISLDDPFFKVLDVDISTTADFAAFDISNIVVDLQYGGTVAAPRIADSATFSPADAATRHFQAFRDLDDFSFRQRTAYRFGASDQIASQRNAWQTDWRTMTSRALVVHPPEDVPMLRVFIEPGVVDWDIVSTIEVHLTYDDPVNRFHTTRPYMVTKDSQRQQWIVRLTDGNRRGYQVQTIWHLADGRSIDGSVRDETATQLFVADPFEKMEIPIIPLVDPHNVTRIELELHYSDPANHLDVRKSVEFVGPNFAQSKVMVPIIDSELRNYTYKVSLIKANGSAETQIERTTDQASIAITEGGIYFDVAVTLVGAMAQLGIDALELDLRSQPLDDAAQKTESLLFDPTTPLKATQRLLLRADLPSPKFEYKTIVFRTGGDPLESEWTSHDRAVLLLQLQRLAHP